MNTSQMNILVVALTSNSSEGLAPPRFPHPDLGLQQIDWKPNAGRMKSVRILCSPYGLCNDERMCRVRGLIDDSGTVVGDGRRLPGR